MRELIKIFEQDELLIELAKENFVFTVRFAGKINFLYPSKVIAPIIEEIHDYLVSHSVKEIQADFLDLKFCNSGGFKNIFTWFRTVSNESKEDIYKVHLIYSKTIAWQSTTLKPLHKAFPELIIDSPY